MKSRHLSSICLAIPLTLGLAGNQLADEVPAQSPAVATVAQVEHYLIELSCDPTDHRGVTGSLRTALALREDGSTVSLFIESAAVLTATADLELQPRDKRREIDAMFDKLRRAGVTVLVCPHCADQLAIEADSLRAGLRFTDKEELEAERERAHKIYQFRPTEPPPADAAQAAGCKPG